MTRPRKTENHHYIPQFMLRQFGHGQGHGHVWVCEKATGRIVKRSVRLSASKPDYYAVNYPDSGRDVTLEKVFGLLESNAAPLLKRLAALEPGTHPLAAGNRDLLAGWLALADARVPGAIDSTLAMAKWAVAVEADMLLRNPEEYRSRSRAAGATESDEDLETQRLKDLRDHEDRTLIVEPAPETGLTTLGIAVEHVRPVLTLMRWQVIRRGRFPWFVLGDRPVTIRRPPYLSPFLGAGFGTPGICERAPKVLRDLHEKYRGERGQPSIAAPSLAGGTWARIR